MRSSSPSGSTRRCAVRRAFSIFAPDIEPERSITTARFTGARFAPGTSTAVTSRVAKTSLVPGTRYGCDNRPGNESEPGLLTGTGTTGGGAGGATTTVGGGGAGGGAEGTRRG